MAVCASLYAVFMGAWQVPAINLLLSEMPNFSYLPHACMLVGMMVLGLGLYTNEGQMPKLSKSLGWQAIGIVAVTLCVAVYNCLLHGAIQMSGLYYFYWPNVWLHVGILVWVASWLWQYVYQKTKGSIDNKAIGVIGLLTAFVAALLLVFMLVSFVRVIAVGRVAGFRVTTWLSWLRPAVMLALSIAYVGGMRGKKLMKHERENQVQRYSKANRVVAWMSVGVLAVLGMVGILGVGFDWFYGSRFEDVYLITVVALVHMLWIGSVIAMMMEKHVKRWLRRLSVLAPLVINGVVMLFLWLEIYLPRRVIMEMDKIYTEDIPIVVLIGSVALVIVVWLINTFVVLRASVRQSRIE